MSSTGTEGRRSAEPSWATRLWWLLVCVLPLGLVGLSILLGQDVHWDLRNYHLHNPWMLLNGRLDKDLAAAGVHTYFNPTLDVLYYWMIHHLPARGVSIVMGAWHATTFLMLLWLAKLVIPTEQRWVHVAVALAGCLGSTFLTEVGNDMGDNSTAPFVLGGLALALSARQLKTLFVGALVVGIAVGLKLTNGPYLIGVCAAAIVGHEDWRRRLTSGALALAGSLVGAALSGGWWFWLTWARFRNPLFPQFNSLLKSPYASDIKVVETRFALHGVWEGLVPRTCNSSTAIESVRRGLQNCFGRSCTPLRLPHSCSSGGLAAICVKLAVAHAFAGPSGDDVSRLQLFGLAVDLCHWTLCRRDGVPAAARPCRSAALLASCAVCRRRGRVDGRIDHHERCQRRWLAAFRGPAASNFDVESPTIQDPDTATVLLLDGGVSWVLASFPSQVLFMSRTIFPRR